MNVLAFDTSTDACSVALRCGEQLLCDHAVVPRGHAQRLLPSIERLLAEAGLSPTALDALVVGCGPGSFTGVRIALSAAQGFAIGADIGVVTVSTLATIAEGCRREHGDVDVLAMLDARMGELYIARYRSEPGEAMRLHGKEGVLAPGEAGLAQAPDAVLAGSGVAALPEAAHVARTLRPEVLPHARDGLTLADERLRAGRLDPPEAAQPVYLRDKVALTEAERGVIAPPPSSGHGPAA